MFRKKKTLGLIICSILFILLPFTLSAKGQQESKKKPVKQEKIVLKFWRNGTETIWVNYIKGYVKRFMDSHPNIKVEYVPIPHSAFPNKLSVAFATGTGPDICGSALNDIARFAQKNQFSPLDSYLDKWQDRNDIIKSVLDMSLYKGKHYALAYYPDPWIFAYRKDFCREAGLDPNTPPVQWSQLREYAKKLTVRKENLVVRSGFQIPIDDFLTYVPFAIQAGGTKTGSTFITKDKKPAFNTKPWVEALQFLTTLWRDDKVSIEDSVMQEWKQNTFSKGNAAISVINVGFLKLMFKNHPGVEKEVGYFFPKKKRECDWSGAWFYAISASSKHKDESWEFIKQYMSKDEMWKRYKAVGNLPVRRSLLNDFKSENPELNAALFHGIEVGVGNPLVPWSPIQLKYIQQAMQESFYGKKSPKQALEDNYNQLMKEIKNNYQ